MDHDIGDFNDLIKALEKYDYTLAMRKEDIYDSGVFRIVKIGESFDEGFGLYVRGKKHASALMEGFIQGLKAAID